MACKLRGGLQQQGRLADPGVATKQDNRCRHKAAAKHTVQLARAEGQARGLWLIGCEVCQGDAFAAASAQGGGAMGAGCLFGDGVPLTAGIAFAGPFGMGGAAACTDKGGGGFGHGGSGEGQARGGDGAEGCEKKRPEAGGAGLISGAEERGGDEQETDDKGRDG